MLVAELSDALTLCIDEAIVAEDAVFVLLELLEDSAAC